MPDTPLRTSSGGRVPVSAVGTSAKTPARTSSAERTCSARSPSQPTSLVGIWGSVVQDAQNAAGSRVNLPNGYRIEYSAQFGSSQQAASLLLWLSIVVVIAMFFILAAAFGSGSLAALIMVNLPLALIAGIAGVFVSGGVLSIGRSSD
jgi:multidrug efflux pump subunit AcrB